MDAGTLFELFQKEKDKFDRAIICHQYGVAMGDIDLMDLSIFAFASQCAGETRETMERRICQCLIRKCDAEDSASWAMYYIASADMGTDYGTKIPFLARILEDAKSPSLRCLVIWTLISWCSRIDQISDAVTFYEMQLDEAEATKLKRGKIYALFDLWAALFACDWILDELQSMGHDDPIAKCLWLFSKGEIAYVMRDSSECLNFHQQAVAEAEKIKPRQSLHEISGTGKVNMTRTLPCGEQQVYDMHMESRLEGFLRFIKARARITKVNYAIKDHGEHEEPGDAFYIPPLSSKAIYKAMNPYVLGVLSDTQIPLFIVLRQEKNLLNRVIIQHQCAVAGEMEHMYKIFPLFVVSTQEDEWLLHERIVRCVVEKCKIGAEEVKAWAFYYVGLLLQDSGAKLNNLKQSLGDGKSPMLRYLASWECYDLVIQPEERLSYSLERVKAAKAFKTCIRARIRALYVLWQDYHSLTMFKEAQETQNELDKFDNALAKGLSLFCQGTLECAMGRYKECMSLQRKAKCTLEEVQKKERIFGIIAMKGVFLTLVANVISEAELLIWQSQVRLGEDNEEDLEAIQNRFLEENMRGVPANDDLRGRYEMDFLNCKADSLFNKGKVEEAKATFLKIMHFSQDRSDCSIVYRRALVGLLRIACSTRNEEEMKSLFNEIEKLETDKETIRSLAEFRANAYFSMGEYDKAIKNLNLTFDMDMDAVNRCDLSTLRISYIDFHKDTFRNMQLFLLMTMRTLDVQSKALVWAERERARDFLYTIQQKSGKSYLSNMAVFDRDDDEALSEILSISSDAGNDTVFIVFSKQREGVRWHSNSRPECPLSMLAYFVRSGEDPKLLLTSFTEQKHGLRSYDLRILYKILIESMEKKLEEAETKRIVFVTTEEIALIPFAALVDRDGKYLIEKYEISTIASLRMFKYCEMRRRHLMEKRESTEALVVANPQLDLPSAEEEGDFVADTLKNAGLNPSLLKGYAATKAAVLSRLPESHWIHMACHTAKISDKIPSGALKLRSQLCDMICNLGALELANVIPSDVDLERSIKTAKTTRKNLLTAEEIHEGKDLRAFVTVLGACSSGMGQFCAEGTLGLSRSFHLAGVPTVVAALWDIDDKATTVLMKRFYINMSSGLSVASALRNAMISMIREMDDETNKPRYKPLHWASLFISGSPFSSLVGSSSSSSHGLP